MNFAFSHKYYGLTQNYYSTDDSTYENIYLIYIFRSKKIYNNTKNSFLSEIFNWIKSAHNDSPQIVLEFNFFYNKLTVKIKSENNGIFEDYGYSRVKEPELEFFWGQEPSSDEITNIIIGEISRQTCK